jgi:drug/metabolite transporter (DMT)-like permease
LNIITAGFDDHKRQPNRVQPKIESAARGLAMTPSQPAYHRWSGLSFALLSALAFGGSGVFAKPLMQLGFSAFEVTWLRLGIMALVMSPLLWRYRGLVRKHWGLFLGYGAFPMAGVQALYFSAVARIPVSIALLIEFMGPILVLIWIGLIQRQPIARSAILGVLLAALGLVALLEVWDGLQLDPVGLLFAALAAGCQALYFILSDSARDRVEPLALLAMGSMVAWLIMSLIAQPWHMPWSLLSSTVTLNQQLIPALWAVAWVGLISAVLAYWAGVNAIRRLSPAVASGVAYLEVVTAIVLAWWLLQEALSVVQVLGAVVVCLGAWLAQRGTPRRAIGA